MKNKTLITKLRKEKGWTQEILVEKCNLSVRTIQRLESGEDGNLTSLNLIAQALDVKIGDLFESIGDPIKEKDISNFNENQSTQIHQRKQFYKLYVIAYWLFIIIMASIAPLAKALGLLWAAM